MKPGRRRVAYFSPLPPETSGIADYSAELIPALAEHLDLELFTASNRTSDETLARDHPVRSYDAFESRDSEAPFDVVLYQVGNSAGHHGPIYRRLLVRPGIVVLHEYMLHNLVRDLALAGPGREEFVEAMRYCYGRTGLAMAGRLLHANNLPEMWRYPLFERVVDRAQSLIVHSAATRDRVLASRPAAPITVVPHHLSLHGFSTPPEGERRELLGALGIAESAFVVASFGHLTASKHLDASLAAFARFRRAHPEAVYLLVGEVSPAYPALREMLDGELGRGVQTTGRVPLDDLLRYMQHCDVAINLRSPTGGETSGACLRLLGLGRPTLVSDLGWFAEIPAGCCAHIEPGEHEAAEIAAVLAALADDAQLRADLGRNAARWAAEHHRLADVARRYAAVVEAAAAHPPRIDTPVPPLSAAPSDLASSLLAEVSAALGDLGLTEEDHEAQRLLAETLVDLELDRAADDERAAV